MLVITVKYQGQHNLTVRGDCVLRVQAQCVGRWFDSQWQHRWSKPGSQSHWMEEILLTGIRIKVSKKCFYFTKMIDLGTSLVAQWLRVCLPVQRTWIWEDSTCCRSTGPFHHRCCAGSPTATAEPVGLKCWRLHTPEHVLCHKRIHR